MEVAKEDPSIAYFLHNSIPSGSLRISAQPPAAQLQAPVAPKSSPPDSARESPRSEVSALNALAAATRSESVGLGASGGSGFDQPDFSLSASGTATGLAGALGLQRQAQVEASGGLELSLPPEQSPSVNVNGLGAPQVQAQAAGEAPSGPYMNMMALNVQPPVPQASIQGGFGVAPAGGSRRSSQASQLNLQGPQLQSQVALQAPDPTLGAQVNAPQSQLLNGQLGLQQRAVNVEPHLNAQMNAPQVNAQLSVPQMNTQRDARQVTAQLKAPQVQVPATGKVKEKKKTNKVLGLFSRKPKDDKRAHASGGVSAPAVKVGVNKPAVGMGVNGPAVGVGVNGPAIGVGVNGPAVGEQMIASQPALGVDMSAPTSIEVSAPAPIVGVKIGANGHAAPAFSGSVRGMHTPIPMPAQPQVDARAGKFKF